MKLIGYILGACLLLALLRAVALALGLLIVGAFIVAVIVRPRETAGWVACLLLLSLIQNHWLIFGTCLGVGLAAVGRSVRKAFKRETGALRQRLSTIKKG